MDLVGCESVVWKGCYSSLAKCAALTVFFQICHLGGVNIKYQFIYMQDFDLGEWHISILKSQDKHNIAIVIHSWVTIEMWIHYYSLYSHQYGTVCPCLPERNMPIRASSSLLLFSKFFVLFTCFLCFYLFEVHLQLLAAPAFSLPHMAGLAQQDTHVSGKALCPAHCCSCGSETKVTLKPNLC